MMILLTCSHCLYSQPCPLKDQAVTVHTHTHIIIGLCHQTTVKQGTSRKRTKIKQATGSSSGQPTSARPGPSKSPQPTTAPAMKTRRRGKKGRQQSTSDSMNEAKDQSPLADVSSYFQHDQSSDDDFEEFSPPQSKRSLAGKLASNRSADSKGKRSKKKGTQSANRPKQQRRSKRLRQDAPRSSPPEGSSPSSPSKRSPSIQDGASSPPSKRLKHSPASSQPKRRSSSTGSETSSSLILHDGSGPDTSSGVPALYGEHHKMASHPLCLPVYR